MKKLVFCFGSNELGRHGAGAALVAYKKYGARMGFSYGHMSSNWGDSFAIPTKDQKLKPLSTHRIGGYVQGFLAYAEGHPELEFQVTRIGCGLAGHKDYDIAPMFKFAPNNLLFDEKWALLLPSWARFWGTYP